MSRRHTAAIKVWGHRGGTADDYPENSLASFEAALAGGCDGIETDVRLLSDGEIVLHHDANFGHTVAATGSLIDWAWKDGVEHLRLKRDPTASIPRLAELLEILMRPENAQVTLNIDCKPQNPAETLFPALHQAIADAAGTDHVERLGRRVVLSIYADVHLRAAERYMPYASRVQLGSDLAKAREVFDRVSGFSMYFSNLALPGGDKFVKECHSAGKSLVAWTVNAPHEWLECARLGIQTVITDRNDDFRAWQKRVEVDDVAQRRIALSHSSLSSLQMIREFYRALDCLMWQRAMIKDAYKGVAVQKTPVLSPKFIAVALLGSGKRLGEPEALEI